MKQLDEIDENEFKIQKWKKKKNAKQMQKNANFLKLLSYFWRLLNEFKTKLK